MSATRSRKSRPTASREGGFTLIELMITVAVVAILAAVAYPSYRRQIMRSNRTEAVSELLKASQLMQSCSTIKGTFVGCVSNHNSATGLYSIAVTATATTYEVTATARAGQGDDMPCNVYKIDQLGNQTSKDKANNATTECWK